ncbi:virulence-associated E family protein, partial [Ramlibacter albus]
PRRAFVASDARRRGHLCTVGNPHGIHLKIGESCSDKRSHFSAWDGQERLARVLVDHAMADDAGSVEYVSAAGRAFFVGSVARVFTPGCKHDTVLVLEGSGGGGKSSFFRVLADAVLPGLFSDSVGDLSNPQSVVEATGGRWIVEIAELAGIRRAADVEALKASITRQEDTVRRPYAPLPVTVPRRFVLAATTNRSEYLHDPSGALMRRFWPVRTLATETNPIDLANLAAAAPQLWGEAVRLFQAGARWWIDQVADATAFAQWARCRNDRRESDPMEDGIIEALMGLAETYASDLQGFPLTEIAKKANDFAALDGNPAAISRLASLLRTLGLESRKDSAGRKRWHFTSASLRDFLERRASLREAAGAVRTRTDPPVHPLKQAKECVGTQVGTREPIRIGRPYPSVTIPGKVDANA